MFILTNINNDEVENFIMYAPIYKRNINSLNNDKQHLIVKFMSFSLRNLSIIALIFDNCNIVFPGRIV